MNENIIRRLQEKRKGKPKKFGYIGLEFEGEYKNKIKSWRDLQFDIDDFVDMELPGNADPEPEPHVTVVYGLTELKRSVIERIIKSYTDKNGKPNFIIGGFSMFNNPRYDVFLMKIKNDSYLQGLNAHIKKNTNVENPSKHPSYVPHLTVGYFKPGLIKDKYSHILGDNPYDGESQIFHKLKFKNANGKSFIIEV